MSVIEMRRVIAVLACLVYLTGCSRAVEIPREQVGAEEYRKVGSYKVRLHGWNEYNVRRFSMTDSTVVIEELLVHDDHYKLRQHDMPIVVPLSEVEYIGVIKTNWLMTTVALLAIGAVAGFIVALSNVDWSDE